MTCSNIYDKTHFTPGVNILLYCIECLVDSIPIMWSMYVRGSFGNLDSGLDMNRWH